MTSSLTLFVTISPSKFLETALVLRNPTTGHESILTHSDLYHAQQKGKTQLKGSTLTVYPSTHRSSTNTSGGPTTMAPSLPHADAWTLASKAMPLCTLLSAFLAYWTCDAPHGWEALFPSTATTGIVLKLTIWSTLLWITTYEHAFAAFGSTKGNADGLEIPVEIVLELPSGGGTGGTAVSGSGSGTTTAKVEGSVHEEGSLGATTAADDISYDAPSESNDILSPSSRPTTPTSIVPSLSMTSASSVEKLSSSTTMSTSTSANASNSASNAKHSSPQTTPKLAPTAAPSTPTTPTPSSTAPPTPTPTKAAPSSETIPFRFIRATKGDITAARTRWADTRKWRADLGMDTILSEPHPNLRVIKDNYPHYFHLRGKKNECCYYERPPKINLSALRKAGVEIEDLLRHYALCCEYMWSRIEDSEDGKSIYVIDLEGIGFRDFAGEVVDFVKRASSFTGAHYPERSGSIFVINVPSWFSVIWNVVKPMVDDVTKKKITIMRYGKEAITKALAEKIDMNNIPPEYGGTSCPLGESPEEVAFEKHFEELNAAANNRMKQML